MKRNRGILLVLFGVCGLLLTACSPILKTFDPFKVQLDYRVPDKRKDSDPDMEIEAQLKKLTATVDRNKYDAVEGDDAYYLLPTGTPLPEGLIDFQSVGMLDENTTCYAYQALYAKDDESGMDDMPTEGKATPFDDIQESPDNLHYMVTFLMTYNTSTKTYKVLYHTIEEVVASYVVVGEDEKEKVDERVTATRLRVSKASALPAGKKATDDLTSADIAALPLCEKIYLRKLDSGSFWFFHEGCGYRYDQNGELVLKQDLNNYLQQVTYKYGPRGLFQTIENGSLHNVFQQIWLKAGDVYTISDIVVDEKGFIYLHLCMTKKEFNIRKGVKKEQIGDPGDNMTQIYCRVCSMDIGSYKNENGEEKNSFRSQNANYQNEVDAWMAADGQVFTFDQEPTKRMIAEAVGSEQLYKTLYPEVYGTFHFNRSQFPAELQLGKMSIVRNGKDGDFYAIVGEPMNPQTLSMLLNNGSIDSGWNPVWMSQRNIRNLFVKLSGQYYIFENAVLPQAASAVNRVYTRTFTVEYTVTETGENGEEEEHTEQKEYTETAIFTEALETVFPSGTNVYYSVETENDASLAQSSGGGVLEYIQSHFDFQTGKVDTSKPLNLNETQISWKGTESYVGLIQQNWMTKRAKDITIPDTLQKILMVQAVDQPGASPMLIASGQEGIYFGNTVETPGSLEKQWIMSGIPYAEMAKEDATPVSGYNYDATRVLYFWSRGKGILYLASPDTGIMKVNVLLGDSYDNLHSPGQRVGRVSQISPYPCFGIYSDASGNISREIAFQTTAYTYEETDQFRAKIYTVPLADAEAELNQVSFVVNANKTLQRTMLTELNHSKGASVNLSSFTNALQNMGIKSTGASHIQSYRAYLLREMSKRIAARKQIGLLAGISATDAFPVYTFDFFHTLAGEIRDAEDVTELVLSMRMARYALHGQQVSMADVKREVEASGAANEESMSEIAAKLNVDFSARSFEQFFFSNTKWAASAYQKGRISGEDFEYALAYTPSMLYYWKSEDSNEIAKMAAYISMYEDIQSRILNGETKVWDDIYTACGLTKSSIERRNKNDSPKLCWIGDYETYIRDKAKQYRAARDEILTAAGMPVNSKTTELSPAEIVQANDRTFFRGLLETDLPMQEEEFVNGTAVEKLIITLCRKWSGIEGIGSKSDAEIIQMQKKDLGYSDRVWKRMLRELKTDLQPDYSRTGYDNRGNFDIRRVADYMEDSWYQAKEEVHTIKNPGELLLESLEKSTQSSESAEPSGSEWKLVGINAGLSEDADSNRLADYYRYLLKEVRDRQSVSKTLQDLSGYSQTQTMNLEERYDLCASEEDVESLLYTLYSERPDVKQIFAETGESGEEKKGMSTEEMGAAMRKENDLTKEQWNKQMETLLSQMQIQVDYESFQDVEKSQKEQKALADMLARRAKRSSELKEYQTYKEGYNIAKRILRWELSLNVYENEVSERPKCSERELSYMRDMTAYVLNDSRAWRILSSYSWTSNECYNVWAIFFMNVGYRAGIEAMSHGRYQDVSPAILSYMQFCKKKLSDRYQDYQKLLELFDMDETEVTDVMQFCDQVIQKSMEWRKTH